MPETLLKHSIGILLCGGQTSVIMQKGTALPANCRGELRIMRVCAQDESKPAIRFDVVELSDDSIGKAEVIDRVEIPNDPLIVNLPADSCLEVTVAVDVSSHISVAVFVPALDMEFRQSLKHSRPRRVEVPDGEVDRVYFFVRAPSSVAAGTYFALDIGAHLGSQRDGVLRRPQGAICHLVTVQPENPPQVSRGAVLVVRLEIDRMAVADPQHAIVWEGEIGTVEFLVSVPRETQDGRRQGVAAIYADGFRIARLHFMLTVGQAVAPVQVIPSQEERHFRVFASYASADRKTVLPRLQDIKRVTPTLDVIDAVLLRSDSCWFRDLWNIISSCNALYLFWSAEARKSKWVEEEWRCAFGMGGLDLINPAPLVSPREVPPPPELAGRHSSDWDLAYKRSNRVDRAG